MHVLISAYSCKPGEVSEPGVAWKQISSIAERSGHTLHVVTRNKNVTPIIEQATLQGLRIHAYGVDLPSWALFWKKGHLAMHLYYYIWQILAYFRAKALINEVGISLAHHVSFMSLRTNMVPFLGIKAIVGPAGGAQLPPPSLKPLIRHKARNAIRTLSIVTMSMSPIWRLFIKKVDWVYVANPDNLWIFPDIHLSKCSVTQIGWLTTEGLDNTRSYTDQNKKIRIYWGGRLLDWKGLELLLRALFVMKDYHDRIQVDITGVGPDERYFKHLCSQLGLDKIVNFHGWCKFSKMKQLQYSCDIYAFTSIHETTGTALMEIMSIGKPIVTINHAGPASLLNKQSGILIDVDTPLDTIVQKYADALALLIDSPVIRAKYAENARMRLYEKFNWETYIDHILEKYETLAGHLPSKEI